MTREKLEPVVLQGEELQLFKEFVAQRAERIEAGRTARDLTALSTLESPGTLACPDCGRLPCRCCDSSVKAA